MLLLKAQMTYKNIQRMRHIVAVLIKHGFYSVVERMNLHRILPLSKRLRKRAMEEAELAIPERIRLVFEELGPTFIKLGQLLSTRPDIFSEGYIEEFRKFQDKVPPFSFDKVIQQIEGELKRNVGELFLDIEKEPVAAASIAQVHRAVLLDGREVVVKVQRPGIEKTIDTDISIMYTLANLLLKYFPELALLDPVAIVDEFSRTIRKEMDFILEASNTLKFRKIFEDDPRVYIPDVYWDYTNKRVLTLERIKGIKVDNLEKLRQKGIEPSRLAHVIGETFLRMVMVEGFFHGDFHAGNIFVLGPERIALVDFGITGRVTKKLKENLSTTFIGLATQDYDMLMEEYSKMGLLQEDIDLTEFKRDYEDLMEPYFAKPFERTSLGELLMNYIRVSVRYKVRHPKELLLINKCIIEIEGLLRLLDPKADLLKEVQPYAAEFIKERYRPGKIFGEIAEDLKEVNALAKEAPSQLRQIMKKMINDKFTIDFVHVGLENFYSEIDRSSNRVSFALIISALIIGSSMIMQSGIGPTFMGFPILGVVGFAFAGILGLGLAISILRSGKF
ncbi:MAG: AarF/ABC1/UbiB kinase family protein [Deltaproteobacteria bacterium]|nr:AarF/ABC1/UbiB kinase family protein [Deltaproteobacteria bacterium]